MQDDVVERSKAEAFLRNHAENCRIEGCHLTAERMDECADLLAQYRATILSLREQLEALQDQISDCRGSHWVGRTELQGKNNHLDAIWRGLVETDDAARSTPQQIKDTPA